MALDLIAELESIIDVLTDAGIEYAVCGGLALGILGHPRMTKDIDLLILPGDVDRSLRSVKTLGYDIPARKLVFRAGGKTEQVMQRVSKLDPETNQLLPIDFLLVTSVFEDVWATRLVATYRERTIHVVSADGLVTMKTLANRPQDLADIAALQRGTDDEEA
jgi:hypothetical protein